ncbi:LysR family transcriptional regulator, partial [Burkholderia gladioli]|uniref:LysR family transcriptional regulator n=1 Tax=Burkholderia gladioli TaxID=28095 RepID=UPI00163E0A8D
MRTRLKTRQLLLVVALAEEGNIHRAAAVLNMTQPAASKLLRELEDMLGTVLFERMPRGVKPTLYGDALIRHARAVLGSLEQAQEELDGLKAGHLGHVAIGTITSPGVRQGHPLLGVPALTLAEVREANWVVPPAGSVLRHRFERMFQRASLAPPA